MKHKPLSVLSTIIYHNFRRVEVLRILIGKPTHFNFFRQRVLGRKNHSGHRFISNNANKFLFLKVSRFV